MRVAHVQLNVIVSDDLQESRNHALLGAELQWSGTCQAHGYRLRNGNVADLANLELTALLDIWV